MKKIIFLLALLLAFAYALLLPACHKDAPDPPVPPPVVLPDTLPPLTTVGANTFGCYVNGKLWLPKADWKAYADPEYFRLLSGLSEGAPYLGGYMKAKTSTDSARQTISFGFSGNLRGKGIFHTNLDGLIDPGKFEVRVLDHLSGKFYYPDYSRLTQSNRLEVTHLDTVLNILSGEFSFTLYEGWDNKITNRKDSLVITNGRFDVKYSQ